MLAKLPVHIPTMQHSIYVYIHHMYYSGSNMLLKCIAIYATIKY